MEKSKLIWILGSNASGKTTQSRLLHSHLSDINSKKLITEKFNEDKITIKATLFNNSSHVGHLKNNQCTGTDTLNTKESIDATFCYLLSLNSKYIIVDGILATYTWCQIFKQFPHLIETYVVLLDFDNIEDNLIRLQERRQNKKPSVILEAISEKTIKNITGKVKGFKSMYKKVLPDFNSGKIIDATLPAETINSIILKDLLCM